MQRLVADGPFRLVGPDGEVAYEIVARSPTDGPGLRPAEWLRLRVQAPRPAAARPARRRARARRAGRASPPPRDAARRCARSRAASRSSTATSGLRIVHTFEDEDDRGDLYDFCPREGAARAQLARRRPRRPRARARRRSARRDRRRHRQPRARSPPARALRRCRRRRRRSAPRRRSAGSSARTAGTHPVAAITAAVTDEPSPPFAVGGPGLHEVELAADGALLLTLFRAVGWMSRGDLSTRVGHAGYNVPTPDAQGLGRLTLPLRHRRRPRRRARARAGHRPAARRRARRAPRPPIAPFLSVEPASVRLSICKRADDGDDGAFLVRLCGPPRGAVTARLRFFRPVGRVTPLRSRRARRPRAPARRRRRHARRPARRARGRDAAGA